MIQKKLKIVGDVPGLTLLKNNVSIPPNLTLVDHPTSSLLLFDLRFWLPLNMI
jgi:hypothetical protein